MPSASKTITLTPDETDDLIYFSRTNDLPSLTETITTLSTQHTCSPHAVLLAALDVDSDGIGSGSSLLHYPAANGNVEIVRYLLGLLGSDATTNTNTDGDGDGDASQSTNHPATTSTSTTTTTNANPDSKPAKALGPSAFINHRNLSGNTALHWAGMNGHLEVVKALVGAGADPGIVNAAGRDAVVESEWSSRDGAEECAVWMLSACGELERGVGGEGIGIGIGEAGDGDDGEDGKDGEEGVNGGADVHIVNGDAAADDEDQQGDVSRNSAS